MKDQLPKTIDPIRLAAKNKQLAGQITLGRLGRIKSMLVEANAGASDEKSVDDNSDVIVKFQLDFGVDRLGIRNIRGRITAQLNLVCQRCLTRMPFELEARVMLGSVLNQAQSDQLPAKYDPLLLETEEVSLLDIIEDEMILAIPVTPMHDAASCESDVAYKQYVVEATVEQSSEVKRENPFAVLATLKSKDKD